MTPADEVRAELLKAQVQHLLSGRGKIDEVSGSPYGTRLAVGSAQSDADRLATIRKKYPGAMPYGEDNFVFADPKTGQRRLHNPPGLDTGDVYGVVPEITELAGGSLAAMAATPAAVAAAVPTGGASLLTVPLAYGLGAQAGKEFQGLLAKTMGSTVDTRSTLDRVVDATTGVMVNAGGDRLGRLAGDAMSKYAVAPVLRQAGRLVNPSGVDRLAQFSQLGISPRPSSVSGSGAVEQVEKLVKMTPGGVGPIRDASQRESQALADAAADMARQYRTTSGRPSSEDALNPEGVGAQVREGMKTAVGQAQARKGVLYDKAYDIIGADRVVTPGDLRPLVEMRRELSRAEGLASRASELAPVLKRIDDLLADAGEGRLTFAQLRAVRTSLGQELGGSPVLMGASSPQISQLKRIYAHLSESMNNIAGKEGGGRAIKVADRFTRMNTKFLKRLDFIQKSELDTAVFDALERHSKQGTEIIRGLRRTLQLSDQPEVFDDVAGLVLGKMGLPTPAQQAVTEIGENVMEAAGNFSARTFLTNWSKYQKAGSTQALFGGTRYEKLVPQLNTLAKVAGYVRDADKLANYSNTAQYVVLGLGLIGSGSTSWGTGASPWEAAASAAGTVSSLYLAPRSVAKLMTSPAFTKWLAQIPRGAGDVADRAGARWFARLGTVMKAEPEIREEVEKLRNGLPGGLPPRPLITSTVPPVIFPRLERSR
jgi:hypothetical protein